MNPVSRILVLGFYNRCNIGDDFYQTTIAKLFATSQVSLRFVSIDDLAPEDITPPEPPDLIIIGGGDIINKYFMTKVEKALKDYTGRVYAFSVGIPYASEGIKYLSIFDHMYLRSREDYELAASVIGKANATYLPDASILYSRVFCWKKLASALNNTTIRIGLCLAQPLFCDNAMGDSILHSICRSIIEITSSLTSVEFHLFAFNYSHHESESDLLINTKLSLLLKLYSRINPINFINHTDIKNSQSMFQALDKMNLIIGSRYHSIMFSTLLKKKFIPLYVSQKIDNLIKDLHLLPQLSLKLPVNGRYQPTSLDSNKLTLAIKTALKTSYDTVWSTLSIPNYKPVLYDMLKRKKTKLVKLQSQTTSQPTDFDTVVHKCCTLLSITPESLHHRGPYPIPTTQTSMDVARVISYIATGSIQSPCIWGLSENLIKPDFCLFEALDYIWKNANPKPMPSPPGPQDPPSPPEVYYPSVNIDRKAFVTIDSYLKTNYSEYHRSGWSYAVGGLMNISASMFSRAPALLLDTYADRTFHWGQSTMLTLKALPYKTPWMGFIHHTFDTTHSSYNCTELFRNPIFIESLQACKGLISLTEYLASQLRKALPDNVHVYVIPHPMEFVTNMFTMDRFLRNPSKKIIQIGAWLRNPFAIYALPISTTPLHKCVLRGKEMDQYFRPPDLFPKLTDLLKTSGATTNHERTCCEDVHCCRDPTATQQNKYCKGLLDHIIECDASVTIIEKLSNEEYDNLLAENIVFLNLIDCSAVNTVLECLVRNTPLIINRHPAVEEIYGPKYPGFYTSLLEAANIATNMKTLAAISDYLSHLDKSKYQLSYFVQKVSEISHVL